MNKVTDEQLAKGLVAEWNTDGAEYFLGHGTIDGWGVMLRFSESTNHKCYTCVREPTPFEVRSILLAEYIRWAGENDIGYNRSPWSKLFWTFCKPYGNKISEHSDPLTALYLAWEKTQ